MSPRAMLLGSNGEARWSAVAVLLALLVAGALIESCAVMRSVAPEKGDDILRFNHADHAQYTPDCRSCHLDTDTEEIVLAGHSSCVECHTAAVDDRPADDSCLLCHTTLTPTFARLAERPDYSAANFDHESHETLDCASCHGHMDKKRVAIFREVAYPAMEDCVSCHFPAIGETANADCFTCHAGLDTGTLPDNHKQFDWKFAHGRISMNEPETCLRCHIESNDCAVCHAMERPQNHTASFRAKTHGFHAIDNPESCEVCHAQDYCEACHQTTEPRNHTSVFKSGPTTHCATCHLPLEDGNRCAVCHKGEPHEGIFATPPPPILVQIGLIDLAEPCLPCHFDFGGPPIPHPFNGFDSLTCVTCHQPL